MTRKSGVLMHVSSLFGDFSSGAFGYEAEKFIDFLSDSGFGIWQTLPFCMPDEYNSPYKSYSSFGANPYFIDLNTLYKKGYITGEELAAARQNTPYLCEYTRLKTERVPLLKKAAERAKKDGTLVLEIEKFIEENPELLNAAKFLALKEINGGKMWQDFTVSEPDEDTLFAWKFIQFEFYRQWFRIKEYANRKGIKIIGDLPIYVALDSADVWANPSDFLLDGDGFPTSVAGVPPDYFTEDGQLWGNPLYDFKKMKSDGYLFWKKRINHALKLFDGIRIDHFRAFEAFWAVPRDAKSAKEGKWIKGPGKEIIKIIKDYAKDSLIIAEDLGDITDGVRKLLDFSGLPGMRVLQFAFLGDENTPHLPHNFEKNTAVYSGTHDNNTLLGYVWELDGNTRKKVFDYFGYHGEDFSEACRVIIKSLLACVADTVIFPIQDLLVFGSDTRMNTPGVSGGNWAYRVTEEQLNLVDRGKYRYLNNLYGRK